MVAAVNYPVALVSSGQNTRITTLQSTDMEGDRTSPGIDIRRRRASAMQHNVIKHRTVALLPAIPGL